MRLIMVEAAVCLQTATFFLSYIIDNKTENIRLQLMSPYIEL